MNIRSLLIALKWTVLGVGGFLALICGIVVTKGALAPVALLGGVVYCLYGMAEEGEID